MSKENKQNILVVTAEIERLLEKSVNDKRSLKSIQNKLGDLYSLINSNERGQNSTSFWEQPAYWAWPESTFYEVGPIGNIRLTGSSPENIEQAFQKFKEAMRAKSLTADSKNSCED